MGSGDEKRFSRREALTGAGAVAAAGLVGALDARTAAGRRVTRRRSKPTVAVLGGGVGGLTVAHELAERGFDVAVYERRALGGKARSFGVPATAAGGRSPLPGEHGFRFFPGFYRNLPDTMRRIPFASNPDGVWGNVVSVPEFMFARDGGRADLTLPVNPDGRHWTPETFRDSVLAAADLGVRVPPNELAWFAQRMLVFFTSCDARRYGQWENQSWWEFIGRAEFSEEYDRMIANNVTRQILAAKASAASARTMGLMTEALVYTLAGPQGTHDYARVLNGPTNEAWIDPWVAHLRRLGVRFHLGQAVESLELRQGRIAAARLRDGHGRRRRIEADWFVSALPVERANQLWNRAILAQDPQLVEMRSLTGDWLSGLQFYLREPTPILYGVVIYIDSEWGLASFSEAQFWNRNLPRHYGNGQVRECFSVDIGSWHEPGAVYGKPARSLRTHEIAREVWEQMKRHLNDRGSAKLRDELIVSWSLDPGILRDRSGRVLANLDPLFINRKGSWQRRPHAATTIDNLLLASDYVRMTVDVACMEGANEAARNAVNALLLRAGSSAEPCQVAELYRPPEWEAFKRVDEERYRLGQPNPFELPWPELPPALRAGTAPSLPLGVGAV